MDDLKAIKDSLEKVESHTLELVKQSAVHNVILQEHKNFSISLQNEQKMMRQELEPIKQHVHFVTLFLKALGAVVVGLAIEFLVKKLIP